MKFDYIMKAPPHQVESGILFCCFLCDWKYLIFRFKETDFVFGSSTAEAAESSSENMKTSLSEEYFMKDQKSLLFSLSRLCPAFVAGYLVLISVLEILAYARKGPFSYIASRIWLFTGMILFGIFLGKAILYLMDDVELHRWDILVCFSVFLLLFVVCIGNIRISDINPDSAAQLTAGLNAFREKDLNYTGTGFLGYPNRQFVLAALPSCLFGRSIAAFHLGFGLLFILGLLSLFFELRKWLVLYACDEKTALLPMCAFLVFPFITEYYRNFEQAITPAALTMLGISLYLQWIRTRDLVTVIPLSWVGCLYADSYTPVLASLGLLLAFLFLHGIGYWDRTADKEKDQEIIPRSSLLTRCFSFLLTLNMAAFFGATLLRERNDRINVLKEGFNFSEDVLKTWVDFFTDKHVRFLGFFAGAVLIYMIFALTFRLGFHHLVIAVWVLGVVVMSNILVGYTAYQKSWIMQRNMIVIPVLITAVFFSCMTWASSFHIRIGKPAFYVLYITGIVIGMLHFGQQHESFQYFRYIQPMKYLISYIESSLKENQLSCKDEFSLVIFTDNQLQSNIQDYANYFFPNASCVSRSTQERNDFVSDPTGRLCLCFSELPYEARYQNAIYEEETFHNYIYHTDHIWYREVSPPLTMINVN